MSSASDSETYPSVTPQSISAQSQSAASCDANNVAERAAEQPGSAGVTANPSSLADADTCGVSGNGKAALSKNQAKRLARMARREATRSEWKARMRLRDAEKRQRRREERLCANCDEDAMRVCAERAAPAGEVVIDLGYESLMNDKEHASLAVQICRSYSAVRNASRPFRLVVCGVSGAARRELQRAYPDYVRWACEMREGSLEQYAANRDLVYLTADSKGVLDTVEENCGIVVGGLVDKNRHKGAALARASAIGMRTARLPLQENVQLRSSPVLTLVHVVQLLAAVHDGVSWADAILATMPGRKNPGS